MKNAEAAQTSRAGWDRQQRQRGRRGAERDRVAALPELDEGRGGRADPDRLAGGLGRLRLTRAAVRNRSTLH